MRRVHRTIAPCLLLLAAGCADEFSFHAGPPQPPKPPGIAVELRGTYCSSETANISFPVKVLFVIDDSAIMATNDVAYTRLSAAQAFIDQYDPVDDDVWFGVANYRRSATLLTAPAFTRDRALLTSALDTSNHTPGGGCGVFRSPLDLARATIEADIKALPGISNRARYVVVFISGDAPRLDTSCASEGFSGVISDRAQAIKDLEVEGPPWAANVTIHSVYVAPGSPDPDARAALRGIASIGGGEYREVAGAPDLTGFDVAPIVHNYILNAPILIANLNTHASMQGLRVDSDADGLGDDEEAALGTNPLIRDSDSDGCGDLMESRYTGWDPLLHGEQGSPPHCVCTPEDRTADADGDLLTNCEEIWLDLHPLRPDSDEDDRKGAIPDFMIDTLEVVDNLLWKKNDSGEDYDMDGVTNLEEIRTHMNPKVNDALMRSDFAYNYEFVGRQRSNPACYDYVVKNVRVMRTVATPTSNEGDNRFLIYFAETPVADANEPGTVHAQQPIINYMDVEQEVQAEFERNGTEDFVPVIRLLDSDFLILGG